MVENNRQEMNLQNGLVVYVYPETCSLQTLIQSLVKYFGIEKKSPLFLKVLVSPLYILLSGIPNEYSLQLHIQSKHSLKECSKCHEVDFYELRGPQKQPREEPMIATVEVQENEEDIHPAADVDEDASDFEPAIPRARVDKRTRRRPACARIDILGNCTGEVPPCSLLTCSIALVTSSISKEEPIPSS